ncbi:MAG: TIGR03085 family metal-binding protein [Cumulibacter sp.]
MTMSVARSEREALCDLLEELGPDAPTLCEGWATRELAAHLVLRERRPDAAAGILLAPLRRHTARVQARIGAHHWADLLAMLRVGPPRFSPFALPGVDARANLTEMYIHHEDIRRAQPDWQPREGDGERYRALEGALMKVGRLLLRSSPVTVRLDPGTGQPFVARSRESVGGVTVIGNPDELTLWCFGREKHARVELIGSESDVAAVRAAHRGL